MDLLRNPEKLHSVVAKIPLPAQYFNYIDGKAVHGGLPTIAVDNPATGESVSESVSVYLLSCACGGAGCVLHDVASFHAHCSVCVCHLLASSLSAFGRH